MDKPPPSNWLINELSAKFGGNNFPTIGEVLRVYFGSFVAQKGKPVSIVLNSIAEELINVWTKFYQPTLPKRSVVRKLRALVKKYNEMRKNQNSKAAASKVAINDFAESLDKSFDIKCVDAIDEAQDKLQSKKGVKRSQTFDVEIVIQSSGDDEADNQNDKNFNDSFSRFQQENLNEVSRSSFRQALISPNVTSVLDRNNLSSRESVMLLGAVAVAVNENTHNSLVSRSTLERHRKINRCKIAASIKKEVSDWGDVLLVVHWDGKMLINSTDPKDLKRKVERHAIVVTGEYGDQILGIPKLESGTGACQAESTFAYLEDWTLTGKIVAMGFDTTASNTGEFNGACVLLEEKIGHPLLYLACRHHFLELIVGAVYDFSFGKSTGPNVLIFEEFQKKWPTIDQTRYSPLKDRFLSSSNGKKLLTETTTFLKTELEKAHARDDYLELVELTLVCLGVQPYEKPYTFKYPGAYHRARWMAKILYSLKIYLFRKQFLLQRGPEIKLKKLCIFLCIVYVKAWMTSSNTADAPINDLSLYKEIIGFAKINPAIANVALNKLKKHLWYLSPEIVPLALFSDKVPVSEKRMIQRSLKICSESWDGRKIRLEETANLETKRLHNLVGPTSIAAMNLLGFDVNFLLKTDPLQWGSAEKFRQMKQVVQNLSVVNDSAERAIALATQVNKCLTKSEEELQQIVLVVADNRKRLPNANKNTIFSHTRR